MSQASKFLNLSIGLLAASMVLSPGDAKSQSLFDLLFGGNRLNRRDRVEPPKEIVKISSPRYYKYKADALQAVDFAPVIEAAGVDALSPKLDGMFAQAVMGLEGQKLVAEPEIGKALQQFYSKRPEFIWVSGYGPNSRAAAAIRVLGEAASYGLEPGDYAVTVPPAVFSMDDMPARLEELIQFEMILSARVLRYINDARNGRVVADRLSGYHDLPRKPVDLVASLNSLARTQEVRTYLESRHPQNEEYTALRRKLEVLRASAENDIIIAPKTFIRPGQSSEEFPKILKLIEQKADGTFRAEYGLLLTSNFDSNDYTPELVPLIKAAQKSHGLNPDGIIGPRTIGVLAGESKADSIEKTLLALERLRWLPSELGNPHVFINQASFMATFTEGGVDKLTTRIIVGKRSNQTYFFYDEIEQVDFNPYWGVPQSILVNEMLPKLRSDPGYLDRAGYVITNVRGQRVSSSSIDWYNYGSKIPFDVRQKPGASNALGELKILFPNSHAIYMHDTPAKNLFEKNVRAFSHGCVRLQKPREMAAAVLGWSVEDVVRKIRQGHDSETVPHKIPVYVSYFTAWPDSSGSIGFYDDVYGRDAHLRTAMETTTSSRQPGS